MRWAIAVLTLGFCASAYGGINWTLIQGLADDAAGPTSQSGTYFHEPLPQAGTDQENDTRSVSTTTFQMQDGLFSVTVTQDRAAGDYKVQSLSQILFTANVDLIWTLSGSYDTTGIGGAAGPATGAVQLYLSNATGGRGTVLYDRELSGANQTYGPAMGNFQAGNDYLLNFSALDTVAQGNDYETTGSGSFSLAITPGQLALPEPSAIAAIFGSLVMMRRRR